MPVLPFGFVLLAPQVALIPLFPLLAFVVLIFFGRRFMRLGAWVSVAALASSCLVTLSLWGLVRSGRWLGVHWAWLSETSPRWTVGLRVDGLSWVMLVIVTLVGTMIQLYSIGYMHGDVRYSRYFAYVSLFCASMLGLAARCSAFNRRSKSMRSR